MLLPNEDQKMYIFCQRQYLVPSPNWSCMSHQWETMGIISAYGILKWIYLKCKGPFSYSYSHCPCEWQADRMPRGPGLHKDQCCDLWHEDKWALWATELSLSTAWAQPACKSSTYSSCCALPGTWGIHSSFGSWVIFFLKLFSRSSLSVSHPHL